MIQDQPSHEPPAQARGRARGGREPKWKALSAPLTIGSGAALLSTFALLGWRRAPLRIGLADTVLLGIATHQVTRVLSGERPTTGVEEPPSARGPALRDLAGPGVATTLAVGLVLRPRETRLALSVLSSLAVADFLRRGYDLLHLRAREAAAVDEAARKANAEYEELQVGHTLPSAGG